MIYLFTLMVILLFIYFFHQDRRNIINIFLFLASLVSIYLSLIAFAYQRWPVIHELLFSGIYLIFPSLLILFAIYMILNGWVMKKKEGESLSNKLSLLMGIAIIVYVILFALVIFQLPKLIALSEQAFSVTLVLFIMISIYFTIFIFIFLALLIYSFLYLYLPNHSKHDFIIVHGSGLINGREVSPLFAARIDKAIEAYVANHNPNIKIIGSGGQGPDEEISEARAIHDYLIDRGIPEEDILMEDESTTTYENLVNSKTIAESLVSNPTYLLVSNNYHVFRVSWYARQLGMKTQGLGARTPGYYLPSAFIREYIAILVKLRYFLIIPLVFFIIFALISFL